MSCGERRDMAEIGNPDPSQPEIDVIPSVLPVPEHFEIPAPQPERRHEPAEPEKVPA
jgi:hypothetical protein